MLENICKWLNLRQDSNVTVCIAARILISEMVFWWQCVDWGRKLLRNLPLFLLCILFLRTLYSVVFIFNSFFHSFALMLCRAQCICISSTKPNKTKILSMKLRTWNQITYDMQNKWSRKQRQSGKSAFSNIHRQHLYLYDLYHKQRAPCYIQFSNVLLSRGWTLKVRKTEVWQFYVLLFSLLFCFWYYIKHHDWHHISNLRKLRILEFQDSLVMKHWEFEEGLGK